MTLALPHPRGQVGHGGHPLILSQRGFIPAVLENLRMVYQSSAIVTRQLAYEVWSKEHTLESWFMVTNDLQLSSDVSEIIAPIPDRHLLHSQQSQRWLYSPSHSPTSSRAVSPTSPNFSHAPSSNSGRHLSFSTLAGQERSGRFSWSLSVLRGEVKIKSKVTSETNRGMGLRWIWWMHRQGMKEWVVPSAVAGSIWIKWCIGLGSYSGMSTAAYWEDLFE
jgi:hypothetical protein